MKTPCRNVCTSAANLFVTLLLLGTLKLQLLAAPLGTAFTYQGRLNAGDNPASGYHDFQFKLFDTLASGVQQGSTIVSNAIAVSNGLFTVTLDFGPGVFNGNARWLDIGVRTNGAGAFTPLTPRQLLTPSPYALYAPSAGAAATAATAASAQAVAASAVTAAGIASGQVVKSLNGLKDIVSLAAGPNVSLATNANTLTISAAGGGATGGWTTTGNAGTTPAANFIGTTDGQPLVINAGNVGINTNDPQATLHVNGTVLASQFAGDGSGLTNVPATLATPFTLTTLAGTNSGGHARGVAVSGRYAYVAQGYAGLHVYEISDPAHPIHVGPATDLTGGANGVALSGHHAFVAGDTLYSVDISSPANPVIVGFAPGTRSCYGVAVSGNVAYLAADADGLFTYNIANPTNPVSLGHIDNGGNAQGVAVSGNFAYLANDLDGLRIYHVANPAAPVNIASRNEGGHARGIAVAGDFAYLANDTEGLRIYNVSNPTNPVSVAQVSDTGYAYGVAVSGRYAYVANNNEGLKVYDISDPAHPTSLGVAPISGDGVALAVAVAGHYAYTANESGGLATYFAAPLATVPGVVGATGFMGDGGSLTNLNAAQLVGQIPPSALGGAWKLGGNAGTTSGQNFLGTTDNQPLEFKVNGQRALRLEPNTASPNVIGGYAGNVVSNGISGATIGGGGSAVFPNRVGASFATVLGGDGNTASGFYSVAMGTSSTASGDVSTALGLEATASGYGSTAMGRNAAASGAFSTAMGNYPTASGDQLTAMGGITKAMGNASTAMGYATTASGNTSTAMGAFTTASGGQSTAMGNRTTASGTNSFAAGTNTVASGEASFAMGINAQATNTAAVALGQNTIAGGAYSTAMGHSAWAIGDASTAMGSLAYAGSGATAMGVWVDASGDHSIAMGTFSQASGRSSTAIGDFNKATGDYSTAMGFFTRASGTNSTSMGFNTDAANSYTMAAGRRAKANHEGAFVWADSQDADFSSAANNQFLIRASGGVVMQADDTDVDLEANQLVIRGNTSTAKQLEIGYKTSGNYATLQAIEQSVGFRPLVLQPSGGRVGIANTVPTTALDVTGTVTATAFSQSSDRNQKEEFTPVNPVEVLDKVAALPISRWNFKGDAASPHVGPMAQDFHAAFGVGTDDKHIATVDADGVALAAIQGLNEKVESGKQKTESRLERLEGENGALKRELMELKKLLNQLSDKPNAGTP